MTRALCPAAMEADAGTSALMAPGVPRADAA